MAKTLLQTIVRLHSHLEESESFHTIIILLFRGLKISQDANIFHFDTNTVASFRRENGFDIVKTKALRV